MLSSRPMFAPIGRRSPVGDRRMSLPLVLAIAGCGGTTAPARTSSPALSPPSPPLQASGNPTSGPVPVECGREGAPSHAPWNRIDPNRWRDALENYQSNIKPGNQVPLASSREDFAHYLIFMHNRIHPVFADGFESSLATLPCDHPLNNPRLIVRLEIVVTPDGRVSRMGVVRTSGVADFDRAALESVDRAQPFGQVPKSIRSPDGLTYMQWEFYRSEIYACSTMGARPFILQEAPQFR